MKKTLPSILLVLFLNSGGILISDVFSTPSVPVKISLALPVESIELNDLDARDKFNRPLMHRSVKSNLRSLFVFSLNSMLLQNLTPQRRDYLEMIATLWTKSSQGIRRIFNRLFETLSMWLKQKEEKTVLRFFRQSVSSTLLSSTSMRIFSESYSLFLLHQSLATTRILR